MDKEGAAARAPDGADFEARSEASNPAEGGGLQLGVRLRIWRELGLVLLLLAALAAVGAWLILSRGAPPVLPGSGSRPLDEYWTAAESRRLAEWDVARSGLPSAGPPPVMLQRPLPPRSSRAKLSVKAVQARQAFDTVSATLRNVRTGAVAEDEQVLPNLDSARAEHLLTLLDQSESGLPPSALGPTNYQRALIHFWSGGITPARTALDNAGCITEAAPSALNRRGLRVGCLWLRGRLAEASERGSGLADLSLATKAALQLRSQNQVGMIFPMRASLHLIEADTADLWQDYLAALLAQRSPNPIEAERDVSVLDLAKAPGDLETRPELSAMLKVLLARQGNFELMKKIPEPGEDGGEGARKLAGIAEIVGSGSADDSIPGLSEADRVEVANWIGHNCRRGQALGDAADCSTEPSPDFAAWESAWSSEFQDKLYGRTTWWSKALAWIVRLLLVGLLIVLGWLLVVSILLGLRRESLYRSKFRPAHFEESSRRAAGAGLARAAGPIDD